MRAIFIGVALAVVAVQAQAQNLPQVSCSSDVGGVFNTTNVSNWQQRIAAASSAPTADEALSAVGFAPAVAVTSLPGPWVSGGGWIADSATGSHSAQGLVYAEYRIDFNLEPAAAASFAPRLNFYADNAVVGVFVNDTQQIDSSGYTAPANPSIYQGYTAANAAVMTLPTGWRPNANSLVIRIISGIPSQGFRANFTGEVACPNMAPVAVPTISGTTMPGSTLTGAYEYSDEESDAEGESILRWVRSDDGDISTTDDNVDLGNATDSYAVQPEDAQKNIFFCVTPIAVTGQPRGAEACTLVLIGQPPIPSGNVQPVPVGGWTAITLLAVLLGFAGIAAQRRKGR